MVQFNWKGTWLPNLPYNENVVVEYNNVNPTQPFTWTNTDRFVWNGSYEIA